MRITIQLFPEDIIKMISDRAHNEVSKHGLPPGEGAVKVAYSIRNEDFEALETLSLHVSVEAEVS